jgi:hypothetical protein
LRLLFNQNIPQPLLRHITGHELLHACHAGWENLVNGDLIAAAEAARFDVLVTADQSLRYQQNLAMRRIGLLVFSTNSWPVLRENVPHIIAAMEQAGRKTYLEIDFPRPTLNRRPPPHTR